VIALFTFAFTRSGADAALLVVGRKTPLSASRAHIPRSAHSPITPVDCNQRARPRGSSASAFFPRASPR